MQEPTFFVEQLDISGRLRADVGSLLSARAAPRDLVCLRLLAASFEAARSFLKEVFRLEIQKPFVLIVMFVKSDLFYSRDPAKR